MRYLGVITLNAGVGKNNQSTAVPFVIPVCPYLYLLTAGADALVEVDAPVVAGVLVATSNSFPLAANVGLKVACKLNMTTSNLVAGLSAGGTSIKVYAAWG